MRTLFTKTSISLALASIAVAGLICFCSCAQKNIEPTSVPTMQAIVTASPTPLPTLVPTPTPLPTPIPTPTYFLGKTIEEAPFYVAADISSENIIGCRKIHVNESVFYYAAENNFYEVHYAGFIGYVEASKIKEQRSVDIDRLPLSVNNMQSDSSTPLTTYVTIEPAPLLQKPYHSSLRVEGCLEVPANQTVDSSITAGDFVYVTYGEYSGYVEASLLMASDNSGEEYVPITLSPEYLRERYAQYKAKNDDTRGWILYQGTNINYPVMYDKTGAFFYNYHDWRRNSATRGSIYLYREPRTQIITIAGHNSRGSGTMFHQLHRIQNNLTRNPGGNRIFWIYLEGLDYSRWEIFAFYEVGINEPTSTRTYNSLSFNLSGDALQEWIDYQLGRSEADLGVTPALSDRFIVLVTCGDVYDPGDGEARLYMFLRSID